MSDLTKTDPRFHVVLDASDPQFAEKLVEAIGAKPGEAIEFITPQFERSDGVIPVVPTFDFGNLASYPEATLRALGCCPWDEPDERGEVLWLFPAEWYDRIPEGHPITDINGDDEEFHHGVTDDDRRFGVLAYGVLRVRRPEDAAPPPPQQAASAAASKKDRLATTKEAGE